MNENVIQSLLFEKMARYTDKVAVECSSRSVSYGELSQKSSFIANIIKLHEMKKGSVVGILIEDRIELISVIIGVLKAGCVFMPLDSNYPQIRLETMLSATNVGLMFVDRCNLHRAEDLKKNSCGSLKIVIVDDLVYSSKDMISFDKTQHEYDPDDMIYIYFTSGTSGKPKAIAGRNKSLLHFVKWEIETFNIEAGYRISQLTSPCHDPFLRDLFVPLCAGGTVCIPENKGVLLNSHSLVQWIDNGRINLIHCTPSLFRVIKLGPLAPGRFTDLKFVLLAGERVIPTELIKWYEIFGERIQLVNMYGPTETTLAKVFYLIKPSDTRMRNIPIGAPIKGSKAIILDKDMNICSQGEIGEIFIRTPYRTLGYYNDPRMTEMKFIQNPFSSEPGDLIYRTGDLGRLLPDGNIEFIGREDRQVKIRGFRVELNEIEQELLKYEGINGCTVVYRQSQDTQNIHDDDHYLVAYFISDEQLSTLELKAFLERALPVYMIPAYFVKLESIPLTSNGKLDYNALPDPKKIDRKVYIAPRNEIEKKLADIWCEILDIEKVGIDENFLEIGGHSLKIMSLISRVYQEFEVELPLEEVFNSRTIEKIAEFIKNAVKNAYLSIGNVKEDSELPPNCFSISFGQKRMYVLNQLDSTGTGYNLPGVMIVNGNLEKERVKQVFKKLVNRHEALRTSIELVDGEPIQKIHEYMDFELDFTDLGENSNTFTGGFEDRIRKAVQDFIKPFDLGNAPLFRATLVRLAEDRHVLMYDMHHIISDGTSVNILMKEFIELYAGHELPELRIQYKDFVMWQKELLSTGIVQKQEEYWIKRFQGDIPVLELPTDYPRPTLQSFEGDSVSFEVNEDLACRLNKLATETGATLFMLLLAAYNILLSKYSGQEDIVVGCPVAGRNHADLENVIGMFVNTLAMRNNLQGNKTFREFLEAVRENSLKAYENQDYQFDELVEKLDIKRNLSRNPVFDTLFVLQNMDDRILGINGINFKPYNFGRKAAKFDLSLYAHEVEGSLRFEFEYCTRLYKEDTIKRLAGHYINILRGITQNPNVILSEIQMLSQKDREQILFDFNNTKVEYKGTKVLHEKFEQQALENPDKIAVIYYGMSLTYGELNKKANQLAMTLIQRGVKPDCIVGIMMERSIWMSVGIMAILKAGGAYMPINPLYPTQRINYMLKDSCAGILLVRGDFVKELDFNGDILQIDDEELYIGNGEKIESAVKPDNLAYVIYTSGSTGKPKGAMIEHHSVVNRINWMQKSYPIHGNDVILQKTPFTFDVSVWELFWWFFGGASVCFLASGGEKDPDAIVNAIAENKVTTVHFVPSMLNTFLEYIEGYSDLGRLASLRHVFASGEALNLKHVKRFNKIIYEKFGTKLHNLYGPTEATVDVSYFECSNGDPLETVPIGKPIDNTRLYILGKELELLPVGVCGELFISGEGVGRGYLNKPELTNEKFLEDPFFKGQRMYKTEDLARWMPDGNVEFLGRNDDQVKVRGFRIELKEIEACLLEHESVKEAVVTAEEGKDEDKHICAYITLREETSFTNIREYLTKVLPDFMIPSYFIPIEKVPLTLNGKVDKKELAELKNSIIPEMGYSAPQNEKEVKLINIWSEILGLQSIGIDDNFFEFGGHSLKAIALASRIHKEFNVEVPLGEIFRNPTIKGLANYISQLGWNIYSEIQPAEERDYYPASSAQNRIYILSCLEKGQINYNMYAATLIKGCLDCVLVEKAFRQLIERHETLRTSFELINGELIQRVNKEVEFKIDYIELEADAGEERLKSIIKEFIKPFNLEKAPLLRIGLIKLSEEKHILVYDMHHIISDGTSVELLVHEFTNLHKGRDLPALRIQYKDYAVWQNNRQSVSSSAEVDKSGPAEYKKQEAYWIERFSGEIPVLNMATDYPRPSVQSFEGDNIQFNIGKELTEKLYKTASKTGTTLYMVLLAAYNVLLSKYTEQEDIVVGCPIAGRYHADLENIIGMFINTLAIRNFPVGNMTFNEFLQKVKESSLEAYANQEYQFEEMVDKLDIRRDLSRNPLFDTMLILQNTGSESIEVEGLCFEPYELDKKIAKMDITLNATEIGGEIDFELEFCTRLFKRVTVQRIATHFINILHEIVKDPEKKLSDIDMLSNEEKDRIVNEFNSTTVEYHHMKSIHQLFEAQVEETPDNIALVFGDAGLTYKEVNERANLLARVLRQKGVKPGSIVAIMAERSIEMIIAIIGTLKAGGAYLPLDPSYPEDRINYMLKDSSAGIMLTQLRLKHKIDSLMGTGSMIGLDVVDLEDKELCIGDSSNLDSINNPDDIAYVIYTSGSTGNPKGVMIEHRSVNNFIKGITDIIEFSPNKTILALTTISFDIFVLETLLPLSKGLRIVIADENQQRDSKLLEEVILKNNIEMLQATPSRIQLLIKSGNLSCLKVLKVIMLGGEAFPQNLLEELCTLSRVRIYNMYGPTETTVWSTVKELTGQKEVNIGKPIANTQVYILDKYKKTIPVGAVGELYIAGDGLAKGYLNRPELTREKFVPNPFNPDKKMYRTGDLARWLTDGSIQYYGRVDNQVKIRGYRVELEEIEKVLKNYIGIKDCIVVVKEDSGGEKHLAAYYIAEEESMVSELRLHLSKKLPEYMIPEYYILLEAFPLTPNGKLDRLALPELSGNRPKLKNEYRPPKTEIERTLADIWGYILKRDIIGTEDNFFELGGNSILLVHMHALVEKEFPSKVNVADIFAYPTISQLAAFIDSNSETAVKNLTFEYLPMPMEYFLDIDEVEEEVTIKFQIDDDIYQRLEKYVADSLNEMYDVLMALFIYLLSEISENKKITAEAVVSGSLFPVSIDLDSISGFSELFETVRKKRINIVSHDTIDLSNISRIKLNKGNYSILPLFSSGNPDCNVTDNFDIVLIEDENKKGAFTCEFNHQRIRKSKVDELIYGYMKLIEVFSERMG